MANKELGVFFDQSTQSCETRAKLGLRGSRVGRLGRGHDGTGIRGHVAPHQADHAHSASREGGTPEWADSMRKARGGGAMNTPENWVPELLSNTI